MEKIYNGDWGNSQVIEPLYSNTATVLLNGYKEGYEKSFFSADWTTKDNNLLTCVQNNIFAFSGAKSFSEMEALRNAVYENGNLLSFSDFKRRARKIDITYNVSYLEAERQVVISSGTQGSRWVDIQETKDVYPYLEYVTSRDEHVREEHRILDGIILPVDDPFWNLYYAPNGWCCRCSSRKLTERLAKHARDRYKGDMPDSNEAQKIAGKVVAKPFRHNTGSTEIIFSPDGHPYFKSNADAKAGQLSAVKNYGMKPAKIIYADPRNLSNYAGGIENEKGYREYWRSLESKHGNVGEGFTLIDKKNSISAHFDNALKEKMLDRGRHDYFNEVVEVFRRPDEIWGTFKSGKAKGFGEEFFNIYMKYYEDKPIVLLVNKDGRVSSFYKLDTIDSAEQFRAGLLKQKR